MTPEERLAKAELAHTRAFSRWERAMERVHTQVRFVAAGAQRVEACRLEYQAARRDPAKRAEKGEWLDVAWAELNRDRDILDQRTERMVWHAMSYERCLRRYWAAKDAMATPALPPELSTH